MKKYFKTGKRKEIREVKKKIQTTLKSPSRD